MKNIKLKNIINESQDGYALHRLANNVGQDTADEFLSKYNVDLKLLTRAIQQKTIDKYELRDIVNGTAHKSIIKKFIKNYVNEDIITEAAGFSAKFTKEQWEVIAYSVSLIESELDSKPRKEAHKVLGTLQGKGIWGTLDDE